MTEKKPALGIPKLKIKDVEKDILKALKSYTDTTHLELYESYMVRADAGEFQPIHKATWFRWVAQLRGGRVKAALTARRVGKHLPVAPPPAYIDQYPGKSVRSLDILGRMDELYEDAKKLRNYSLSEEGKVKSPKFLAESIKIRRDLLESALEAVKEVYNLERMEEFYRVIQEEIMAESPEVGARIIDRLRRANEKHMMTPDCDPRIRDHNAPPRQTTTPAAAAAANLDDGALF